MTYAIDDGDGNRLTAGLGEHEAERVAQRIANSTGEPVYLYEMSENEEESETIEVKPETGELD